VQKLPNLWNHLFLVNNGVGVAILELFRESHDFILAYYIHSSRPSGQKRDSTCSNCTWYLLNSLKVGKFCHPQDVKWILKIVWLLDCKCINIFKIAHWWTGCQYCITAKFLLWDIYSSHTEMAPKFGLQLLSGLRQASMSFDNRFGHPVGGLGSVEKLYPSSSFRLHNVRKIIKYLQSNSERRGTYSSCGVLV